MSSQIFRARVKRLDLSRRTAIMGVVNITKDSFYAASRFPDVNAATAEALRLAEAGADILDIGGESTRPGARPVSTQEELDRVLPVLEHLRSQTDRMLSVDTRKAEVAEGALANGADIVNDITALGGDLRMAEVAASAGAGVILMHMRGRPETMQSEPRYDDVVAEVKASLRRAVARAERAGIASDAILVDPGIGFGKTVSHNLRLLNELATLTGLGKPILVGTSRKGFIGKLLSSEAEARIFGTAASVAAAILRGASIVRVHDVSEMRDVATVADAIRNASSRCTTSVNDGPFEGASAVRSPS